MSQCDWGSIGGLFLPSNQMGQLKHYMFVLMVFKIHEMNTLDT